MVAFWIKGGVDVYSRFLKNIKVSNAWLSPTEYINLRMVNTLILNAFHCTRLLSSEQYLENCKSYRLWKKKLNHVSGGFREFLGRVATRISRSDFEIGPCDSDEETRTREAVNEWTKIGTPLGVQPTYKVVEAKYLRGAGHDKRLRKGAYANAPEHTMVSTMNTKGDCALCCELCAKKKVHTCRLGYKQSYECKICGVRLCRKGRNGNQKSCFERFHTQSRIETCQGVGVYSPQVRAFRARVRNPELPVPRAPASGERRRRRGAQSNLTSRFHQSEQTNSTRRVTRASSRSSNRSNNAVASRTRSNQHTSYESLERRLKRRRTENPRIW